MYLKYPQKNYCYNVTNSCFCAPKDCMNSSSNVRLLYIPVPHSKKKFLRFFFHSFFYIFLIFNDIFVYDISFSYLLIYLSCPYIMNGGYLIALIFIYHLFICPHYKILWKWIISEVAQSVLRQLRIIFRNIKKIYGETYFNYNKTHF